MQNIIFINVFTMQTRTYSPTYAYTINNRHTQNNNALRMSLRHPKMLRREYLIRSPIWKTYIANPTQCAIPEELYKINTKLYCAYTISEVLRASTNSQALLRKFDQYCQDKRYGDDYENLDKVRGYLKIVGLKESDWGQYIRKLVDIYDMILEKYGEQQQISHAEQVQAIYRKSGKQTALTETIDFTPFTLYQKYLHNILTISNSNALDDIDVLILSSTHPSISQLHALKKIKHEWSQKYQNNVLTLNVFRSFVIRNVCEGNWDDVGLLGIFIQKFGLYLADQRKMIEQKKAEESMDSQNLFLQTLNSLWCQQKQIPVQTLKLLNKPLPQAYANSKFKTYLDCLLNQHTLFLNWLSIKCLFEPTKQKFGLAIERVLSFSTLINLHELNQNKSEKGTKSEVKYRWTGIQLCKLEIISNLCDQVGKNLKMQFDLQHNIKNLRNTVLSLQKIVDKLIHQKSKNSLQDKVRNIRYIESVINLNNCNASVHRKCVEELIGQPSLRTRNVINNQAIGKLSQKYIEDIINYDVILLSKEDVEPVYRVIEDLALRKGVLSHKINEYYKKLAKYANKQQETKAWEQQKNQVVGNRIGSLRETKQLWELLTKESRALEKQRKAELEDARRNIFILQDNKGRKKNQKQEEQEQDQRRKTLRMKINQFFAQVNQ